jgi:hypothetical protein
MANKTISQFSSDSGLTGTELFLIMDSGVTKNVVLSSVKTFVLSGSSFSGGTVSGSTNFISGLSATTVSATTYENLPISGLTAGSNISISGNNGNKTISFTGSTSLSFTGNTVPSGSNSSGNEGNIIVNNGFLYYYSNNGWLRLTGSTF